MPPAIWRLAAISIIAGMLTACETVKPAPSILSVEEQAARPPTNLFSELPGWDREDHVAALAAFRSACPAAKDPALLQSCSEAMALGQADEARSRAFFERSFRPELIPGKGLLTGYFAPEYEARTSPDGEFTAPVRPRPADLPASGQGAYPDREIIEARPVGDALAWMRPEDLFFLQIQGSGILTFPDGVRAMAVSNGTNGAPFLGLALPMRQAGLLADGSTSGEAIRGWLASHRGPQAAALMDLNPRYVFFRLIADTGLDPKGAAGIPLVPGRSVAVDRDFHAFGDLMWIDAENPHLVGATQDYQRLVVALDTGGAIRGDARADLYLGRGPIAGLEAGRVRHILQLYRLRPVVR